MVALSDGEQSENSLKVRRFLEKKFPTIMFYVEMLKENGSIQMVTQQMEADLIRSFIIENPNFDVLPAHDGLFCGEKDAEWVEAALEKFLKKQGMVGATKITYYNRKSRPMTIVEILSQLA